MEQPRSARVLAENRQTLTTRAVSERWDPGFVARNSGLFDEYFAARLEEIRQSLPGEVPALVAVGGYGRNELSLFSDVDVLILYKTRVPAEAGTFARQVFFPLWDLGLDLGHGVRDIADCLALGASEFQVLTSLLDARFVAGDKTAFEELHGALDYELLPRVGRDYAARLGKQREERDLMYGDASSQIEPDIKNGRGGLRDYHDMVWLSKAAFGAKSPRDLAALGLLSHPEYEAAAGHLDFLLKVRNRLHLVCGRKNDRLFLPLQEEVAAGLGCQDSPDAPAVEVFLAALHREMSELKELSRSFWSAYGGQGGRPARTRAEPVSENIVLKRGELYFEPPDSPVARPLLLMEIFRHSADTGAPLSWEARRLVGEHLEIAADRLNDSREAAEVFMHALTSPRAFETLEQMYETGLLGAFIPEYGRVQDNVQFDAYHLYPVGRHTLHAVHNVHELALGDRGLFSDIYRHLAHPERLLLGAFFHDIGKDGPGHEARGEKIAAQVLARWAVGKDTIRDVRFLVRNHLLLGVTATRRDLSDESAIVQVASQAGTPQRLKMLFLLTWADAKATGPKAYNDWTANLLTELYFKVLRVLEHGVLSEPDAAVKMVQTRDRVRVLAGKKRDPKIVEDMLAVMSPRYTLVMEPGEIVSHFDLLDELEEALKQDARSRSAKAAGKGVLVMRVQRFETRNCYKVTMAARHAPELFYTVAGVMALGGINILSADLFVWKNNTAVYVFMVCEPPDSLYADRAFERVRTGTSKALTGRLALGYRLAVKRDSLLAEPGKPGPGPAVNVDNESSDFSTIIEVVCDDRIGRLFDIASVLFELKLDVHSAKIATQGDRVADVFYVRGYDGQKVRDPEQIREVEQALLHALGSRPPARR